MNQSDEVWGSKVATRRILTILAAGLALLAAPGLAWAQDEQDEPPIVEAEDQEASNITPYAPAFFAEYRPNTAMDMINRLPGFSFDGGSGARGFAGTAGNVLIDGERPPSRGDPLSSVLSRIPASAVLRIDVVRGGAGGIDMQGKPLVANVIRKPDAGLTGAVSSGINVALNGYVSPNGQVQLRRQKNGRLLEGSLSASRNNQVQTGFRLRTNPDGTIREFLDGVSTFESQRFETTGAFETALMGGNMRANIQANTQQNEGNERGIRLVPQGIDISFNENQRHAGEVGLRYSRNIAAAEVELVAFQSLVQSESSGESVQQAFTTGSINDSKSGESIGNVSVRLPALGDWSLESGAEAAFNFTDSQSIRTLDGAPFGLAGDSSRVEELRTELFGVATWSPNDKLSVESAVRYEQSTISATSNVGESEKTLRFVKPRLNVSWTPAAGHQFGFRVERVVEQLSFGAFASSVNFNSSLDTTIIGVGNLELEPERAWVATLRYERRFGSQGSVVAELVHRDIEALLGRVIVLAPTPTDPTRTAEITRNVGTATRTSINLSGTIPLDGLGMKGGLFSFGGSVRESETIDPVTFVSRRLNNDTPFSWNVSLTQNIQRLNLRWSVFMEGDSDSAAYSPQTITSGQGGYFLGANFSWKPRPDLTLGGGLNNIAGNGGRNRTIFFDAPRNIGAPLYYELRSGGGIPTAFVNMRKSF